MYFFASDYDGTLYQDSQVSQKDLRLIKEFRAQGHHFGIATGRHLNSILGELDKYQIEVDFTIGNNGSAILDHNRKELYLAAIDKAMVKEAYDYVVKHMSDEFYFIAINNGYHYGQKTFYQELESFDAGDRISLEDAFNSETICAMFGQILPGKDSLLISNQLNEAFKGKLQACPNGSFVDIVLPNDNKARAIQRVVSSLDSRVKKVFTIGDSYNDIEMIQMYDGFVIAGGEDHLRGLSDKRVATVGEALELVMSGVL